MPRPLVTVVEAKSYLTKAERIMTDEERELVVALLAANPTAGVVIPGTRGLRKLRVGLGRRGKRGGGRVVYWFHNDDRPVFLLWAFAKNEASDLSAQQRRLLMREVDDAMSDIGERR